MYTVASLDAVESAAFRAHYPTCSLCQDEVDDYREAAVQLAVAVADVPPSALRDRVLAAVDVTRQVSPLVGAPSGPIPSRPTNWGWGAGLSRPSVAGRLVVTNARRRRRPER